MKKKVIILLLVLLVIIGTSAGIFILYNQAVADKKEKTADPIKIETPEKPTEPEEELKKEEIAAWESITVEEHVKKYMAEGMSEKDAMKQAAKDRGITKRDIYAQLKK